MERDNIFKTLINKFGDKQMVVAIEELSELQKELCKAIRGQEVKENIIEEIADVSIMLCQIMIYFEIEEADVIKVMDKKIQRTMNRLLGGEENDSQ